MVLVLWPWSCVPILVRFVQCPEKCIINTYRDRFPGCVCVCVWRLALSWRTRSRRPYVVFVSAPGRTHLSRMLFPVADLPFSTACSPLFSSLPFALSAFGSGRFFSFNFFCCKCPSPSNSAGNSHDISHASCLVSALTSPWPKLLANISHDDPSTLVYKSQSSL